MHLLNEDVSYTKKLLVFYDLLGFKDLINENLNRPEIIKTILDTVYKYSKSNTYDFHLLNFSDSIILIFEPENPLPDIPFKYYLNNILENVNRVQVNLLLQFKVAIRGAIVLDDIYYNPQENIIFGPALNKAAGLEKNAYYPRVIIDKAIIEKLNINEKHEMTFLNFTIDEEKNYYANPFHFIAQTKYEQKNSHMQNLKKVIVEIIQDIKEWDINQKPYKKDVLHKFNWLLLKLIEREVEDLNSARQKLNS